jgi:predicted NUDIX family NTP pyrophosphohydrolase
MKKSAGIILYKRTDADILVFLVHPGGPFWRNKDEGAWSIPKGEYLDGEDPLAAARREFAEETGQTVEGDFVKLGDYKQPGGKLVSAWALEGDCDASAIRSNTFTIAWPPKSGKAVEFPEVDRAQWFAPEEAACRLLKGQVAILEDLLKHLLQSARATNAPP